MRRAVVIVAAGSGSRMGGALPKQFLMLQGKPLILHTMERFWLFDPEMKVVVVLAQAHGKLWEQLVGSYEIARGVTIANGGATRYDSVKNGLSHIAGGVITGIHDAVRPFASLETLDRSYHAALLEGSGIPVIEMDESVRMLDQQRGSVHMDRSRLRRVQTPQVFSSDRIKQAYQQPYDEVFTDDASVYESAFGPVTLVEGNRENIKITTPTDMKMASLLLMDSAG
jgi:2-C-methyl-D-erythritol 4-phosphate cytidylyltransferase